MRLKHTDRALVRYCNSMKTLCSIAFIICCHHWCFGQKTLAQQLKQADTVLLISHSMVAGSSDALADSQCQRMRLPNLFVDGKLNKELVIESKVLSTGETDVLSGTLTYTYKPGKENIHSCFTPHHTIVVMKGGKTSFIKLCFHCQDFETSSDIVGLEIKQDKWAKLRKLFKAHGFRYELNLEK